jgi:RNA polymerase sigma-70 factor (ECF subfamily)
MSRDITTAYAAAGMAMQVAQLEVGAIPPERLGVVFGADMIYSPMSDLEAAFQGCIVDGPYDHARWGVAADVPFAGRSSLRTWLTGILKHKIADAYRGRARAPVSLEALRADEEPGETGVAADDGQFDFGGDPLKQLEHKRFWEAFQRELKRLPARTAEAFVASEFTPAAADEVCSRFGMSPGSLWVLRCRTRMALRTALAPALAG